MGLGTRLGLESLSVAYAVVSILGPVIMYASEQVTLTLLLFICTVYKCFKCVCVCVCVCLCMCVCVCLCVCVFLYPVLIF